MLALHVATGIVLAAAFLGFCLRIYLWRERILQLFGIAAAPIWAKRRAIGITASIAVLALAFLAWKDDQLRDQRNRANNAAAYSAWIEKSKLPR